MRGGGGGGGGGIKWKKTIFFKKSNSRWRVWLWLYCDVVINIIAMDMLDNDDTMNANVFEPVEMIPTDRKDYQNCSLSVEVCI